MLSPNSTDSFLSGPPAQLWPAHWIKPASDDKSSGITLYRRVFDLASVPSTFKIRVTGDSRYELHVNGKRVAFGPSRGDIKHWRYRVLDIAPYLQTGRNVLAASVMYLNPSLAPWAQVSHESAFLLCGNEHATELVNTPGGWKALKCEGIRFSHYWVIGPSEEWDASKYPWGWETPGYDDSHWVAPAAGNPGTPRGAQDGPSIVWLTPDTLPMQEMTVQPISNFIRAAGMVCPQKWPVEAPTHSNITILLDNTTLSTAFPVLKVNGGKGATVTLRYSEALFDEKNQKANRNDTKGRHMEGYVDTFHCDGGHRSFRPHWWRTFRYLQVEIQTNDEPLTIEEIAPEFTAYPFTENGTFDASDKSLGKIWEVGWRTARLCAHETYMDCPYYEQLQYGGDTRIQCLVSLYVSGDDRLMRNAIRQLDDSRLTDGITQSRYPCWNTQVIPPFALWWIGMIHDFWMFRTDDAFIKQVLPGARESMEWFIRHLTPAGLLGPLPWWNFVDWASEFPYGVPVGAKEGQSAILSLQTSIALREMAQLERALGEPEFAARYERLAGKVNAAVITHCLDKKRGLIADTPDKKSFSQHANSLAILSGAFDGKQMKELAQKLLTEPLIQATFYFRFYLHRALRRAGKGEEYLDWLKPWHNMLEMGLSTWAECPQPTRSDCHAWSAHPNVDLLATVLGVEAAAPGFSRVSVTPHLGKLDWANGKVPHPAGEIEVKLKREGKLLLAEITLPAGIHGVFKYSGKETALHPGKAALKQEIK